jgi:hypothetical protein
MNQEFLPLSPLVRLHRKPEGRIRRATNVAESASNFRRTPIEAAAENKALFKVYHEDATSPSGAGDDTAK